MPGWKLILSWVSKSEISLCKYTIALVTCSLVIIFSLYFPDILLWNSSSSVPQNTSTVGRKDRGGKEQALGCGYRFVPKQTMGQETVVGWFCPHLC